MNWQISESAAQQKYSTPFIQSLEESCKVDKLGAELRLIRASPVAPDPETSE